MKRILILLLVAVWLVVGVAEEPMSLMFDDMESASVIEFENGAGSDALFLLCWEEDGTIRTREIAANGEVITVQNGAVGFWCGKSGDWSVQADNWPEAEFRRNGEDLTFPGDVSALDESGSTHYFAPTEALPSDSATTFTLMGGGRAMMVIVRCETMKVRYTLNETGDTVTVNDCPFVPVDCGGFRFDGIQKPVVLLDGAQVELAKTESGWMYADVPTGAHVLNVNGEEMPFTGVSVPQMTLGSATVDAGAAIALDETSKPEGVDWLVTLQTADGEVAATAANGVLVMPQAYDAAYTLVIEEYAQDNLLHVVRIPVATNPMPALQVNFDRVEMNADGTRMRVFLNDTEINAADAKIIAKGKVEIDVNGTLCADPSGREDATVLTLNDLPLSLFPAGGTDAVVSANDMSFTIHVNRSRAAEISVNTDVNDKTTDLTGTTVPDSMVSCSNGQGTIRAIADENGAFEFHFEPQSAGTVLTIAVVTPEGETRETSLTVTAKEIAPIADVTFTRGDLGEFKAAGTGEPGKKVSLAASGKILDTQNISVDGTFTLIGKQESAFENLNGESVSLTVQYSDGTYADQPVSSTLEDTEPPKLVIERSSTKNDVVQMSVTGADEVNWIIDGKPANGTDGLYGRHEVLGRAVDAAGNVLLINDTYTFYTLRAEIESMPVSEVEYDRDAIFVVKGTLMTTDRDVLNVLSLRYNGCDSNDGRGTIGEITQDENGLYRAPFTATYKPTRTEMFEDGMMFNIAYPLTLYLYGGRTLYLHADENGRLYADQQSENTYCVSIMSESGTIMDLVLAGVATLLALVGIVLMYIGMRKNAANKNSGGIPERIS